MNKYHRQIWVSISLMGITFLMVTPIWGAASSPAALPQQVSQCQTSLKEASTHLEERSQALDQPYYDSLYQQTRNLLKNLENLPATATKLAECQNFLKVIGRVAGKHVVSLGSMPSQASLPEGKLTTSISETAQKRPLRKAKTVHYILEEEGGKFKNKDLDGENEELHFVSTSPSKQADKLKDRE